MSNDTMDGVKEALIEGLRQPIVDLIGDAADAVKVSAHVGEMLFDRYMKEDDEGLELVKKTGRMVAMRELRQLRVEARTGLEDALGGALSFGASFLQGILAKKIGFTGGF